MALVKKAITTFYLSFLVFPTTTSAGLLDGLKGKGKASELSAINTLIVNVGNLITNVAGALALLMIIVGGIIYITSAGNPEKAEQGKKYLTYAIIGFIIVITAKVLIAVFARLLGGSYS